VNKFQEAICKKYADGDFSYLIDLPEGVTWREQFEADGHDDTLFLFIMIELADSGDEKMDRSNAITRMMDAQSDIGVAMAACAVAK
jgi:hypothetical protein